MNWRLISTVQRGEESCCTNDFITADDEVPICHNIFSDDWESEFMDQVGTCSTSCKLPHIEVESENESEDEDEGTSVQVHGPTFTSFSEVVQVLEGVALFLDNKGHTDTASDTSRLATIVASLHYSSINSARQSTLDEFVQ